MTSLHQTINFLKVCIFILFPILSFGQSSFPVSVLSKIDSIATKDVPPNAPGIATGIVKNGKVIYQKYAGYANLEDSIEISPTTRFNIASNAKQFTALAILLLEEAGKLNLEIDIRKYWPELFPEVKDPITIRHLLQHTSGIRDVYDLWSLQGITWWEKPFSNKDVVTLVHKQQALNFAPGSLYLYSNTNYILLAEIVGKVSGMSFVAYTNSMFKKLNMPNTSFCDKAVELTGNIAKPYFNYDTWYNYPWIWNVSGDGNLFTTLEDQLQWEMIVQADKPIGISKAVVAKSQHLPARSTNRKYGFGLEFGERNSSNYTFHEGATGAWKATFLRYPEQKTALLTMTNSGKVTPDNQTRQMADVLMQRPTSLPNFKTAPNKASTFVKAEDINGTYRDEGGTTFQFEYRDSALYLLRFGRNDIRLVREAANIFHQWNDPAFKQEFKKNAQGAMEVTAYYTSHAPYTLKRIDADWTGFDFTSLNGTFENAESAVQIEIRYLEGKNYEVKIAGNATKGLLVSPKQLLVNQYTFDFNTPNALFYLQGGRIKNVTFHKLP